MSDLRKILGLEDTEAEKRQRELGERLFHFAMTNPGQAEAFLRMNPEDCAPHRPRKHVESRVIKPKQIGGETK